MITAASHREFIEAVATEMSAGIQAVLECWMSKIERSLDSNTLTTLGRLQAVQEIMRDYRSLSGNINLDGRRSAAAH